MSKKLLIPTLGLAALLIVAGVTAVGSAYAESGSDGLAQRLAERFNLNEDEVQSFFEDVHEERMALMHANMEDNLDQAVEDGVINEQQKEAIINKMAEMHARHQEEHEEMQAWFEENGIDPQALRTYHGFGWHMMKIH